MTSENDGLNFRFSWVSHGMTAFLLHTNTCTTCPPHAIYPTSQPASHSLLVKWSCHLLMVFWKYSFLMYSDCFQQQQRHHQQQAHSTCLTACYSFVESELCKLWLHPTSTQPDPTQLVKTTIDTGTFMASNYNLCVSRCLCCWLTKVSTSLHTSSWWWWWWSGQRQ